MNGGLLLSWVIEIARVLARDMCYGMDWDASPSTMEAKTPCSFCPNSLFLPTNSRFSSFPARLLCRQESFCQAFAHPQESLPLILRTIRWLFPFFLACMMAQSLRSVSPMLWWRRTGRRRATNESCSSACTTNCPTFVSFQQWDSPIKTGAWIDNTKTHCALYNALKSHENAQFNTRWLAGWVCTTRRSIGIVRLKAYVFCLFVFLFSVFYITCNRIVTFFWRVNNCVLAIFVRWALHRAAIIHRAAAPPALAVKDLWNWSMRKFFLRQKEVRKKRKQGLHGTNSRDFKALKLIVLVGWNCWKNALIQEMRMQCGCWGSALNMGWAAQLMLRERRRFSIGQRILRTLLVYFFQRKKRGTANWG